MIHLQKAFSADKLTRKNLALYDKYMKSFLRTLRSACDFFVDGSKKRCYRTKVVYVHEDGSA